ncbi:MAG: DUF1501 domain-containing protein, partial [Pirellulaceae bacterium]|nr:DUF1501 domain-containing protein [Pirellulaceae bacterium]
MITLAGRKHRLCGGLERREFLRLGALGLGGLTLADLLRCEALGANAGRPKSIIYVVLPGGPSHIDMYDLKPDAPVEYRGPFRPIQTRLSGVQICEMLPLQAGIMDQLALLRGICSVENDHYMSEVYTGLPRTAGKRPAFGSVASRLGSTPSPLPTYVSLRQESDPYDAPHYAGSQHAPFRPFGAVLEDLTPAKSADQLPDRRNLLRALDSLRRDLDANAFTAVDSFQAKALDIITSPRVRDAFDLSKEPDKVVASYGGGKYTHAVAKQYLYDWPAKNFLLARRLVEAGVRVVTFDAGSWDHHGTPTTDIFYSLRHQLAALD